MKNKKSNRKGSHVNVMGPFFQANPARISNMASPLHGIYPIGMRTGDRAFFSHGGSISPMSLPLMLDPYGMASALSRARYQQGGNVSPVYYDNKGNVIPNTMGDTTPGGSSQSYHLETLAPQPVNRGRLDIYPEMVRLGVVDPTKVTQDDIINMPKAQFDDLFFNKFAPARANASNARLVTSSPPGAQTIRSTNFDVSRTGSVPTATSTPAQTITFADAFAAARNSGLPTFTFDGKSYSTNLAPSYSAEAERAARNRTETIPGSSSSSSSGQPLMRADVRDKYFIRQQANGGYMRYQEGGEMGMPEQSMGDPSNAHMQQLAMGQPGQPQPQGGDQQQQVQQLIMAAASGDPQAMQMLIQLVGEQKAQQLISQIQQQQASQQAQQPQMAVMLFGGYVRNRRASKKTKAKSGKK